MVRGRTTESVLILLLLHSQLGKGFEAELSFQPFFIFILSLLEQIQVHNLSLDVLSCKAQPTNSSEMMDIGHARACKSQHSAPAQHLH